ncbi:hypothetical protein [Streptomyces fuscigenes]|uniref:hypothetical protein n=1 Tax=Streptomyces fuscigenes TaxID=1528880 RepID=UPI001F454447|nr:hypothetical protein [Streptomyces fuscigenes]MCF3963347.1 hypothetical protein [Streptomyces fuscigenes]
MSAPAAIPVGRRTLHASVTDGTVLLSESQAGSRTTMTLSGTGGHAHLRTNGAGVDVTVRRLTGATAVLDIDAS